MLVLWLMVLYLVPTIVASVRRMPTLSTVAVINVLLGWTLLGWFWAFVIAVDDRPMTDSEVDAALGEHGPATGPTPPLGTRAPSAAGPRPLPPPGAPSLARSPLPPPRHHPSRTPRPPSPGR